jgi:hypothetical protein
MRAPFAIGMFYLCSGYEGWKDAQCIFTDYTDIADQEPAPAASLSLRCARRVAELWSLQLSAWAIGRGPLAWVF